MNALTVRHIVNKLLKPSRVLLSTHKRFELVLLMCLGRQPFVPTEYDMRAYHHNAECSPMSTLPLCPKNTTLASFGRPSAPPPTCKHVNMAVAGLWLNGHKAALRAER